jgi:hypothetical protein
VLAATACQVETSFDISTHPTHVSHALVPNANNAMLLGARADFAAAIGGAASSAAKGTALAGASLEIAVF